MNYLEYIKHRLEKKKAYVTWKSLRYESDTDMPYIETLSNQWHLVSDMLMTFVI